MDDHAVIVVFYLPTLLLRKVKSGLDSSIFHMFYFYRRSRSRDKSSRSSRRDRSRSPRSKDDKKDPKKESSSSRCVTIALQ